MKEYRLNNWEKKKELDCLLFLALRIRELTFDYTLDSFKYPALNSTSICIEAIKLIDEIQLNNSSPKSIEPVLKELIWKLKLDPIAKEINGDNLEYYLNFGDFENLNDIKIKLEILINKINPTKYTLKSEDKIIELVKENKQKKLLNKILTNYITSLINLGFSQSYIYLVTNNYFFSNTPINSVEILEAFFNLFKNDVQKYTIIFKCSDILAEIKSSSEEFDCLVTNTSVDYIKSDKKNFLKSKNNNELFFIVKNVIALDPVSAKKEGESRINKISKLFVFYHHKEHPTWSSKALIINDTHKNGFLINEKISPMSKGRDLIPKKAGIKLNKLIKGLSLEKKSFAKYDRAIDLHGLSVENKYIENQLLQNWIAFETLLVGYSKKSKIDQVIENLIPFLLHKYLKRIIKELLKDISRFNYKLISSEIRKIAVGDDLIEKFTALIVLEEYKPNRVELYKALELNPILKFRLSQFNVILSKSKNIKEYLETHELKVNWQIKRMYRSRNLIVHAGIIPDYTEVLVENSHTYIDLLINTINDLSINENSIFSIEQAIKEIEIQVKKQFKNLSSNIDGEINKDNYKSLILG